MSRYRHPARGRARIAEDNRAAGTYVPPSHTYRIDVRERIVYLNFTEEYVWTG